MKLKYLFFVLYLFCLPSCQKQNNSTQGLENISYASYQQKIEDKDNFYLFLADESKTEYETFYNLLQNYYKYYGEIFLKLDLSLQNEDVISKLQADAESKNCTNIYNSLFIYLHGNLHKANHFNALKTPELLANYINDLDEFMTSIVEDVDETISGLIETQKEIIAEKIANKETFLLFIGQETCAHCKSCKEVLTSYIQKTKQKIYLLNIKKEDINYLFDTLNLTIQYTPTFITYSAGDIVNFYVGCYMENDLNRLFKKGN